MGAPELPAEFITRPGEKIRDGMLGACATKAGLFHLGRYRINPFSRIHNALDAEILCGAPRSEVAGSVAWGTEKFNEAAYEQRCSDCYNALIMENAG